MRSKYSKTPLFNHIVDLIRIFIKSRSKFNKAMSHEYYRILDKLYQVELCVRSAYNAERNCDKNYHLRNAEQILDMIEVILTTVLELKYIRPITSARILETFDKIDQNVVRWRKSTEE